MLSGCGFKGLLRFLNRVLLWLLRRENHRFLLLFGFLLCLLYLRFCFVLSWRWSLSPKWILRCSRFHWGLEWPRLHSWLLSFLNLLSLLLLLLSRLDWSLLRSLACRSWNSSRGAHLPRPCSRPNWPHRSCRHIWRILLLRWWLLDLKRISFNLLRITAVLLLICTNILLPLYLLFDLFLWFIWLCVTLNHSWCCFHNRRSNIWFLQLSEFLLQFLNLIDG